MAFITTEIPFCQLLTSRKKDAKSVFPVKKKVQRPHPPIHHHVILFENAKHGDVDRVSVMLSSALRPETVLLPPNKQAVQVIKHSEKVLEVWVERGARPVVSVTPSLLSKGRLVHSNTFIL